MQISHRFITAMIFTVMLATMAVPTAAIGNEDVPLVDGALWVKSSHSEKISYLVGAGNLMVVEYLFQTGSKNMPSDDQTIIQRLYKATDGQTLDGLIERIDTWYQDHPDKMNEPVLVVIWKDIVEPYLAETK